jgi:hypothetical protein
MNRETEREWNWNVMFFMSLGYSLSNSEQMATEEQQSKTLAELEAK